MTGVMRMALMRGNYNAPESRRRRDSRGRYMEGGYGARSAYDNYMTFDEYQPPYAAPENRRKMGFARAMDEREMNDNDIRWRNTGREDGSFSEQGEDYRYPTNRGGGNRMSMGGGAGHQAHGRVMQMRGMQMHRMHGNQEEEVEPLDKETAEEWVKSMSNTDPERPEGGCWTYKEVKDLIEEQQMQLKEEQIVEFYAILNAVWSDYYKVAKKYGHHEDEQFFIDLALAWLADEDAVDDKAAVYYQYIVKKE